jgi:predicted GH43/DUF377 family glycosyl hydrolase
VLDEQHPNLIRYRSPEPVLTPELPKEREGIVSNVVFPTAIDRRDDLGFPGRFDVYYGMADNCIGVARLDLPEHLPAVATSKVSAGTNTIERRHMNRADPDKAPQPGEKCLGRED